MLSYEESLKILKESNALIDGHFILSSGLHSAQYVQCAQLLSKPSKAHNLCHSLAEKIKMIVNHGEKIKYYHEIIGCNSRLDSIQAEILNIKLKYLDAYNSNRKTMANNYNLAFNEIEEVLTPKVLANSEHVFHQYTLRILNGKRDNFKTYISDLGIPSMIYYPIPIHKQKPYKNDQILENTDMLSDEVISLPIHTELENSNQEFIIDKIITYFK